MLLMIVIVLVMLLTEPCVVGWCRRLLQTQRDKREAHRALRRRCAMTPERAARHLATQNARARCQELGVCPRLDTSTAPAEWTGS